MFRSSNFSLALQKRSIPPNKVELRQAIAVVTSSSSSSKPKHSIKNNNNTKIHHHSPSKTISTTKDNALLLLANIPRDGITVQKLSEQFFFNNNNYSSGCCYFSSFNEFSSALDFLRENCYEILRFHRISGQGREKIMFVESTASHDDRRIGLDCVRHTLGKFTQHYITQSMIDADEAEKRRRVAMEVEMPLENDSNSNNKDDDDDDSNRSTSIRRDINVEQEKEHCSLSSSSSNICNHNGNNSTVLADEFIDALRRDLKQERDARLAEEKKNRMLRKQLMDVLRIVMKSKIVTTTPKSKKSTRKKTATRDLKN